MKTQIFHELTHLGLRIVIGCLFIVHGIPKFDPSTKNFFVSLGLPAEMALLTGLLEIVGGILLVAGVMTRITASLLAFEMLSIMFYVKKLESFSGKGGIELDLLCFVILLTMIVIGPGRIAFAQIVKKIPRILQ